MKTRKNAFTLIEVLVVIAIISLLLAIIAPGVNSARKQAQAVVCSARIREWALCYALYTANHDGKFPPYIGGTYDTTYMEALRPYYDDMNKMRTCPSATGISTINPTTLQSKSYFGSTTTAWQIDSTQAQWLVDNDWGIGSYGESSWIRSYGPDTYGDLQWVQTGSIKDPTKVPFIMDARWNNAWPDNTDGFSRPVARETDYYGLWNWSRMQCFAMYRHKDGINAAFGDGAVRHISAEGLWILKWNRKSIPNLNPPWLSWLEQISLE